MLKIKEFVEKNEKSIIKSTIEAGGYKDEEYVAMLLRTFYSKLYRSIRISNLKRTKEFEKLYLLKYSGNSFERKKACKEIKARIQMEKEDMALDYKIGKQIARKCYKEYLKENKK